MPTTEYSAGEKILRGLAAIVGALLVIFGGGCVAISLIVFSADRSSVEMLLIAGVLFGVGIALFRWGNKKPPTRFPPVREP
jgi:hypothetical protein